MHQSLIFFVFSCLSLRFVKLLKSEHAIKSSAQIVDNIKEVRRMFNNTQSIDISELWNTDSFMLLDGNRIAAYISVDTSTFLQPQPWLFSLFPRPDKKFVDLGLFSISVVEKYRGKGLSGELMGMVRDYYLTRYRPYEAFFSLHLSPMDEYMPIAAKVYYTLGFVKYTWVKYGSKCFKRNLNLYFENCVDFYQICKNPELSQTKGHYLASICFLGDYNGRKHRTPKEWRDLGEDIRKTMLERKNAV